MERKVKIFKISKVLKKSQVKKLKHQNPSLLEANSVVEVHLSESVHLVLVGLPVAVVAAEVVSRSFKDSEWPLCHLGLITAPHQHLMKNLEAGSHHHPRLSLPSLSHSGMRMKRPIISLLHVLLHLPPPKGQCPTEQVLFQSKGWILYLLTYSSVLRRFHPIISLGHHFVNLFFLGMGLHGNLLVGIYRLEVREDVQEAVYLSKKPDRPHSLVTISVL